MFTGDGKKCAIWGESGVELRVQTRPVPCSLPVILGSSSRHRRAVMEELGWEVRSTHEVSA